jgi:hypothetical protein
MWRVWLAPNNVSKWQMGFNSAFKGLINIKLCFCYSGHTTDLTITNQELIEVVFTKILPENNPLIESALKRVS